jgi:hypothetical protein
MAVADHGACPAVAVAAATTGRRTPLVVVLVLKIV